MTDRPPATSCSSCGAEIDRCEFCEEEDCPKAICYQCVREALGQAMPPLHVHGG